MVTVYKNGEARLKKQGGNRSPPGDSIIFLFQFRSVDWGLSLYGYWQQQYLNLKEHPYVSRNEMAYPRYRTHRDFVRRCNGAQQYVWSSNLGPEMFESIQQTRIIYMIAGLARFIGIGATIAGGVMCIVDSKPNRQVDGV